MIEESIRKLGFKVEDIKVIINGHAHSDHAGAIASLKAKLGAQLAVMREDVPAMEGGGKDDFHYGWDWKVMGFPPAKVDRILRNGDTIRMGDVLLTAHHTPGHTRGSTTWVANIVDHGKAYTVAFPDGGGFNPGYRVARNPSYPSMTDDYRRTHHFHEMLKPGHLPRRAPGVFQSRGQAEARGHRGGKGVDQPGGIPAVHRRAEAQDRGSGGPGNGGEARNEMTGKRMTNAPSMRSLGVATRFLRTKINPSRLN